MKDNCKHENFKTTVKVARLTDDENSDKITGYNADIEIHCTECMKPFVFVGVPMGYSPNQPMCSFDGTELRAPIVPFK